MLQRDGNVYTEGEFVVAPQKDQCLIAEAYLLMKAQGLLEILYYQSIPDLATHMQLMLSEKTVFLAGFRRTDLYTKFIGFSVVVESDCMGHGWKRAEQSCLFFKEFQRRDITTPVANLMMRWVFERTDTDFLFGVTPEPNRAMVRFARSLGYEMSRVPNAATFNGEPCAALISSMSEAQWRKLNQNQVA